jgi:hypothetical protein
MKYKATERYSMGWTDPRAFANRVQIKFGNYTIANLIANLIGVSGSPHPSKVEIMRASKDAPIESLYADQKEFAAYIEAFLKEQHERNNSGL